MTTTNTQQASHTPLQIATQNLFAGSLIDELLDSDEQNVISEALQKYPELLKENEQLKQELVNLEELYRYEAKKAGEKGSRLGTEKAINAELLEALNKISSAWQTGNVKGLGEIAISAIAKAEGK